MKNRNTRRFQLFASTILVSLAVLGAVAIINIVALTLPPEFAFLAAAALIGAAGAVIEDLREDTTESEHLVRDVGMAMTYVDEVDDVPLDQLLRRAKRRKPAKSVIVEWPRKDRTAGRVTAANGGIAGGAGAQTLAVDDGSIFRANDIVYLPDNAASAGKLLLVTAVATNNLTVYALDAETVKTNARTGSSFGTVPLIADDEKVIRLTTSKTESDTPSDPRATQPEYDFNFVQTFDAVIEASDHRQATANYTIHDWIRDQKDQVIEFRRGIENDLHFGERTATTDPGNSRLRWTAAGTARFISQSIGYTIGNVSENNLVDIMVQIFTGNTGKKNRLLFADKFLCAEFDKVMLAKMQHLPKRKRAGVTMSAIESRHGTLWIVHHPMYDNLQLEHYGQVLDLSCIHRAELRPMKRRKLDYKGSGGRDADAIQFIEKSTLTLENPDACFEIIGS